MRKYAIYEHQFDEHSAIDSAQRVSNARKGSRGSVVAVKPHLIPQPSKQPLSPVLNAPVRLSLNNSGDQEAVTNRLFLLVKAFL